MMQSLSNKGTRFLKVPVSELRQSFDAMNAVMDTTLNWHFEANVWNYK